VYIYIYSAYTVYAVYTFLTYIQTYIHIHTNIAFFGEKGDVVNQTANTPEVWGERFNVL